MGAFLKLVEATHSIHGPLEVCHVHLGPLRGGALRRVEEGSGSAGTYPAQKLVKEALVWVYTTVLFLLNASHSLGPVAVQVLEYNVNQHNPLLIHFTGVTFPYTVALQGISDS